MVGSMGLAPTGLINHMKGFRLDSHVMGRHRRASGWDGHDPICIFEHGWLLNGEWLEKGMNGGLGTRQKVVCHSGERCWGQRGRVLKEHFNI